MAAGATAAPAAKPVPTDPSTGRATIGGRARRDAAADAAPPTPRVQAAHAASTAPVAAVGRDPAGVTRCRRPTSSTRRQSDPGACSSSRSARRLRGMTKAIYMGAHVGTMSAWRTGHQLRRRAASRSRRGVPRRGRAGTGGARPVGRFRCHWWSTRRRHARRQRRAVEARSSQPDRPTKTSTPATSSTCRPMPWCRRSIGLPRRSLVREIIEERT